MASSPAKSEKNCSKSDIASSADKNSFSVNRNFHRKKSNINKPKNFVWISPVSDFKEKIAETEEILLSLNNVTINATGSSIPLAINLGLILSTSHKTSLQTSTYTSYNNGYGNRSTALPAIKIVLRLKAVS